MQKKPEDKGKDGKKEPEYNFKILVNGEKKEVHQKEITFEKVVDLAYEFEPKPDGENVSFTVVYDKGPTDNPEGDMVPGNTVTLADGMDFVVTSTDKS